MKFTKKLFATFAMVTVLVASSTAPVAVSARTIDFSEYGINTDPSGCCHYTPFDYEYRINGILVDFGSATAYFADWYEGFLFCFTDCIGSYYWVMPVYAVDVEFIDPEEFEHIHINHKELFPGTEYCNCNSELYSVGTPYISHYVNLYYLTGVQGPYVHAWDDNESIVTYTYTGSVYTESHFIDIYPEIGTLVNF